MGHKLHQWRGLQPARLWSCGKLFGRQNSLRKARL